MDPDPAEARRKARQLINNIAQEHTLNGTIFGTQLELLVNNCLEILSNQLYEKSTHFLLELIQNADDNIYTCTTPTLSFSYKPGCLRIDCNEVGFDASNVAAICGISQSTKSGKSSDGEFIGEKGIGFKSVFKAADTVWIASNEFAFKFDRTKPLGVITPLWEEFPEQTESCGTSIFLRLSTSYDEQTLVKELHEFDTNVLIFLRRVEEINIEVNCADLSLWKKQIRKTQYEQDSDRVVVLQTGADSLKYLIRTHVVKDLPQEVKRRDWTETNILLAFPLPSEEEKPMLKPQNVYAFLPIRNYGFKFLIQADFILTASREDIESTLLWNVRIRDALPEAFLSSMLHFNEGVLKYVWPFYLPSLSIVMSGFFEPAIEIILSQLGESPVFESCAGNMVRPSTLAHVPADFCANGEPFTLCDFTKDRYLSSHYASWVIEAMTSVGVSQLTPRQFLDDLATLIATDAESFHKRTSKWQTQLATTLVKLSTDAELMPLIQDLAIIPLNDGTWTAARDNNIFFAKSDASLAIPDGIRILIVDSDAESDSNRRTLFTSLGVKAWEAPEICRLMLTVHASADFRPEQLTTTQIVSHAMFLYQAKWQPPKGADLWFATARNKRFRGREVYISGSPNADPAAARVFAVLEKQFPVMHADYLTALAGEPEWLDWLVQNLGLSRIPRLVTPVVVPRPRPMEAPRENESLSRNQLDPSSGDTQARKVSPPPDSEEDSMAQVVDGSSTVVHRQPVPFENPLLTTEPFPSFNDIAVQANSTEPFPSFDEPVVQINSTKPLIFVSPPDLLDHDRAHPRKTMTVACKQCQMSTRILKCDRGHPACGTCIRHNRQCYYSQSQDIPTSSSTDVRWRNVIWSLGLSEESQDVKKLPVGEKAPVPASTTNNTGSGAQYVSGMGNRGVTTERLQDSAKGLDMDSSTKLSDTYTVRSGVEPGPVPTNSLPAALVAQYPALADLNVNELPVGPLDEIEGDFTWRSSFDTSNELLVGENQLISVSKVSERTLTPENGRKSKHTAHVATMAQEALGETNAVKNENLGLPEQLAEESVEPKEVLFDLSEEFKSMLHECDSFDIFQLIRDNWHHYSQWIEGAHMKWQSQEYVSASMQLKDKIGASLVRTVRGPLPLHETVLAKLDMQLDQSKVVPALQLHEPENTEWNLLTYFGVVVKSDVHYYLRCLTILSRDEAPDIDVVGYIYEQIQSRYTGNEGLIRAAFYSKDIILINPDGQPSVSQAYWTNMENCISRGIDLTSTYANCSYLFRCLFSPSGDPIGGLVHTMTMISSSSKLEDIARLFREVSKLLKNVNSSKMSLLLKPLQGKAIFPVVDGSRNPGYDTLLSMHDKTWFIADRANLIASFTGVVPLLAFSIQDLPAIEDLLRALRVDGRKISKKVTGQTRVVGRTRSDFRYTDKFRLKSPFIKALIPRDHPAEATLRRQITQLRVRIATGVLQTFTMTLSNKEVHGKPIPGYASMMSTDGSMTLVMTEEAATAECPSHELVSMLAQTCGIQEQHHITLLLIALGKSSLKSIKAAFLQQGIKVEGLLLDNSEAEENPLHAVEGIDEVRMPSSFTEEMGHGMSGGLGLPEGLKFEAHGNGEDEQNQDPDRRIPMLPRIKGAGNTYSKIPLSELERKEDEFIECDHMQFLGENMVARLLGVHLGSSFDPVRDWTSDLRERAGFTYVPEDSSVAPFTLTQAETIRRMTDFVVQYGVSRCEGWQERLRTSSPTYHVDVLVSGDSTGRFVMEAKWLERTMKLRLPSHQDDNIQHVNVLIHVAQAYSEANFYFDVIVDPWHLVYSGKLKFTKNWLMQASLGERSADKDDETSLREDGNVSLNQKAAAVTDKDKQLVLYKGTGQTTGSSSVGTTDGPNRQALGTLYLPWSQTEATGILQSHGPSFHTTGRRELYSYKPLLHGYIRLLYLLPGTSEGPLQAVLNHIACNYAGTYQALSYVWGADLRDKELVTPDGIIPITTSLYKALLALRQNDQAVMVWVDAVCINQADTKEKAQQIRLMPEIFQACECTYSFLSEGSPAIDQALEMLMQVRARTVREERQRSKGDDADEKDLPQIMSTWGGNRLPPLDSPIWSSVKALFTLPYFRRAWIIQEVVAAPNVKFVCGEWLIDWKDLYAALEVLDREVQIAEYEEGISDIRASWEPFTKLAVQREWEARQHRWNLLMLLEHFQYAESTLSRDRLFALVGLASDGNEADFEPDYDSSFQDIVLRFAQAFVRQGRGIQLLYRAGVSCSEHDAKLPSWIPHWTSKRPIGLHDSSDPGLTFSACGPQPPHLTLGPGPNDLSVDGYDMDTILTITTASNTESEWAAYFAEIDTMIDDGVLSDTMGPKENLKWKVPIAAAPFPRTESYSAFRKYLTTPFHIPTNNRYDLELNAHKSYTACLQGTLAGWKFVVTKRGFAGVVPGLSQVGDVVAIMKGGCVPFVLRESGERWILVGECYVHGIMKGEGLWLPGVKEKTFCLY